MLYIAFFSCFYLFFKLRSEIKTKDPTSNSLHKIPSLMFMSHAKNISR